MATRAARGLGQYSGVARAIERVGERWALLIVRDLLAGARRYSDLKASLPRIPTNILSDRLKELAESGIIRRVPTVRGGYELTDLGRELEPVVLALERWGWSSLGAPADSEVLTPDALALSLRAAFRADAAAALPPTELVLHVGGVSVVAALTRGVLSVVPVGAGALPQPRPSPLVAVVAPDIAEAEFAPTVLRDLVAGVVTPDAAIDAREVRLVAGERAVFARFATMFRIETVPDPERATDAAPGASVA